MWQYPVNPRKANHSRPSDPVAMPDAPYALAKSVSMIAIAPVDVTRAISVVESDAFQTGYQKYPPALTIAHELPVVMDGLNVVTPPVLAYSREMDAVPSQVGNQTLLLRPFANETGSAPAGSVYSVNRPARTMLCDARSLIGACTIPSTWGGSATSR
jgi:hypothetical protein